MATVNLRCTARSCAAPLTSKALVRAGPGRPRAQKSRRLDYTLIGGTAPDYDNAPSRSTDESRRSSRLAQRVERSLCAISITSGVS